MPVPSEDAEEALEQRNVCRIQGGKHFRPEDHLDVLAEEIRGLVAEVAAR